MAERPDGWGRSFRSRGRVQGRPNRVPHRLLVLLADHSDVCHVRNVSFRGAHSRSLRVDHRTEPRARVTATGGTPLGWRSLAELGRRKLLTRDRPYTRRREEPPRRRRDDLHDRRSQLLERDVSARDTVHRRASRLRQITLRQGHPHCCHVGADVAGAPRVTHVSSVDLQQQILPGSSPSGSARYWYDPEKIAWQGPGHLLHTYDAGEPAAERFTTCRIR